MTDENVTFQDYGRFISIAPRIDAGMSFDEIYKSTKLSVNTIKDTIHRLEERCRVQLVIPADRNLGKNSLTDSGKELLDQLRKMLKPGWLGPQQPLRLAVSSTLMTGVILTPAFADYARDHDEASDPVSTVGGIAQQLGVRLQLSVASANTLQSIVDSLQQSKLDMAFVWDCGLEPRLSGLHHEKFDTEFDVVVISWDKKRIDAISELKDYDPDTVKWSELGQSRVALMPRLTQPHLDRIEFPTVSKGADRILVDTFEAAIACVKARVADYAIVPAIYAELERSMQDGIVYFSRPISKISLMLLARSRKIKEREPIKTFVKHVDEYLRRHRHRYQPVTHNRPTRVIQDPSFYESLFYGYYIEREKEDGRARWKCERVQFRRTNVSPNSAASLRDDTTTFEGRIENEFGGAFNVVASLMQEAFVVEARRDEAQHVDPSGDHSVVTFVSLFSLSWPDPGIIYGTWTGWTETDESGAPVLYGTIYSVKKLSIEEIEDYCRSAELGTAIRSEHFSDKFDRQFAQE